jgi:hypothetical protein
VRAINVRPFKNLLSYMAELRPSLSSGQQETLKWLAIVTMVCHTTDMILFNTSFPALVWISRLAFPLFAFLIAYNLVVRQVKATRYLWPLLIFALFTQPVKILLWGGYEGDIFFTLYFGVLYVGLHGLLTKRLQPLLSHTLLAVIFLLPALQVEYGPAGVFLIPVLVFYLRHPAPLTYVLVNVYFLAVNDFQPYAYVALLLLPLIFFLSRYPITLRRSNPWFFYSFYPIHLIFLHFLAPYVSQYFK